MHKKQEQLLDKMIAIYIRDGEPIGSESLRLNVDMKISSATIRNYFKVLVDEGVLAQPHISSGKIPTNNTLKSYWRTKIDVANIIEIDDFDIVNEASKQYKIFCNIKILKQEKLQKLINYENKYSILIFDNTELIVPYTKHLHNFLNELLYQDIEDIKNIAKSVCANSLYEKLENISGAKVYNFGFEELNFIKDLEFTLNLIKGQIYYELKNGIYFDLLGEGYLGVLQDIKFKKYYGKMFVAGGLRRDYVSFYNKIAS